MDPLGHQRFISVNINSLFEVIATLSEQESPLLDTVMQIENEIPLNMQMQIESNQLSTFIITFNN